MRPSLPIVDGERRRDPKPPWLKVRAPGGAGYVELKERARRLHLATVCEEARCPNIGECWGGGTATFMLMGDTCTRGCRFCAVTTRKNPDPLDPGEPEAIATAVREMRLRYVVLTTVDRDDVEDGGAAHLEACVRAIRAASPETLLELLMPDFAGDRAAIARLAHAPLDVAAHNLETVERLTPTVRDRRAGYRQSLAVLAQLHAERPARLTKSSLMLGLGEREDEVVAALEDLRAAGVSILTLGQYLRPTERHLEVVEYLPPERFERLGERARELGFDYVASGPLVRSSYRAAELYLEKRLSPSAQ